MDESEVIVAFAAAYVVYSVAAASFVLHHTGILTEPRFPLYKGHYVLELISALTRPYAPSTDEQRQIDAAVSAFAQLARPPSSFLLLCRNSSRFERLTRFSVAEFLLLYQELEADLSRPYACKRGVDEDDCRERRLHPVDQLLLWLWEEGDGNDPDTSGVAFNAVSRSTARRVADHVTRAVNNAWADDVSWPDEEERQQTRGFFSSHDRAVGVLDSSHCQIQVPVVGRHRNHPKQYRMLTYLICVDALGYVIHAAGPIGASEDDRAAFNSTLSVQRDGPLLSEGEVILVDGGFAAEARALHPFAEADLLVRSGHCGQSEFTRR